MQDYTSSFNNDEANMIERTESRKMFPDEADFQRELELQKQERTNLAHSWRYKENNKKRIEQQRRQNIKVVEIRISEDHLGDDEELKLKSVIEIEEDSVLLREGDISQSNSSSMYTFDLID
jgi:hypothetical protein